MLRVCAVTLALFVGLMNSVAVRAQAPEVTVAARSVNELSTVLASFGNRGEMFGLNGPAAFLNSYGRWINDQQPLTAALTFTSKTPMFAAEFATTSSADFFAALAKDGFELDAKTNQLSKAGSSLRFFVRQTGNTVRIADNAEFLNTRWPAAETFASQVAVVARVDWRNLKPELRSAVAQQAMSNFLPQATPMATFSIDTLPELVSSAAAARVAGLFANSETMTLQFSIPESGRVTVAVDVVHRALAGRATVPSPFATLNNEQKIAGCEWNTPVDSELRTMIQAWAAQLVGFSKQLFAGDEIGDDSGLKVLHEGAGILARHAVETIALPNLQGSLSTLSDGTHPIIVGGIRVANPARLDSELQKLIKLAIENGAPFEFTANVASGNDLSIHRLQLPIAAELTSARELFGESLTIHLSTSSHALLVGVGKGSDKILVDLVSPTNGPSNRWIDATVGGQSSELVTKLGLKPCQLRVTPAAQGFQVTTTLLQAKSPTQLTSTRADSE